MDISSKVLWVILIILFILLGIGTWNWVDPNGILSFVGWFVLWLVLDFISGTTITVLVVAMTIEDDYDDYD